MPATTNPAPTTPSRRRSGLLARLAAAAAGATAQADQFFTSMKAAGY
jgi:hypothetical protein